MKYKCTSCGSNHGPFRSGEWSASRGQIIADNELLCPTCAAQRGALVLKEKHKEQEAQHILEKHARYFHQKPHYRCNVFNVGLCTANCPRELKIKLMKRL